MADRGRLEFDIALARGGFLLEVAGSFALAGVTAISGGSGSGKTSLLRALAGLEGPCGSIRAGGIEIGNRPIHQRAVGMVFQEPRLFPHLNVVQNINYGAARRAAQGQVHEVIRALDLIPLLSRMPGTLSGGEARRVALARAMAAAPDILMLDEPLTGLDTPLRHALLGEIARVIDLFDVPALYVSHARDEIAALADEELTMVDGALRPAPIQPQRLVFPAEAGADGPVGRLAGQEIALPAQAAPGSLWQLRAIGAVVQMARDPGPSDFDLVLPGVADGPAQEGAVRIGDQRLILPQKETMPGDAAAASGMIAPGTPVWIGMKTLILRPMAV